MVDPFGTEAVRPMSAAEERVAPFEARLRSTWRQLVWRVSHLLAASRGRRPAGLAVEDVVQEVVRQLVESDHLWDPDRARYTTFVKAVTRTVLHRSRERAGTVPAPPGAARLLLQLRDRDKAGVLTLRRRGTMHQLAAAIAGATSLNGLVVADRAAPDGAAVERLRHLLGRLTDPLEIWILTRKYGLFGERPLTLDQIAARLQLPPAAARRRVRAADRSLRRVARSGVRGADEDEEG